LYHQLWRIRKERGGDYRKKKAVSLVSIFLPFFSLFEQSEGPEREWKLACLLLIDYSFLPPELGAINPLETRREVMGWRLDDAVQSLEIVCCIVG
jgi:hypothetical protein